MPYKLKYVGNIYYPKYFVIPTYYENVKVIDGIAIVEKEVTKDRLLKEGFVLIEDKKEVIDLEKVIEEEKLEGKDSSFKKGSKKTK